MTLFSRGACSARGKPRGYMKREHPMSTIPAPVKRHALKLPPGSVRAIHVLGIVALVCAIILIPARSGVAPIPPYLVYLLFLMLGHYFAAHGVTIATRDDPSPSPLYLPGGVVRVLIILLLIGCIGWKLYDNPSGLKDQFEASLAALRTDPYLPLVILGCFLLGVIVRGVVGRTNPPAAWQDFEAWISLIALLGLFIAGVIHLGISMMLPEWLHLPTWEAGVGGVIAFYFGERS
jgi:hypothetical protein